MMNLNWKSALVLIALCAIIAWEDMPVFALSSNGLVLEVIPSSIQLYPDENAEVLVTIRNLSETDTASNIQVSWFQTGNLNIRIESLQRDKLEPHGAGTFRIWISQPEGEIVSGKVFLRVDYSLNADEISSTSDVAYSTIEIIGKDYTRIDQIAAVNVRVNSDLINEKKPVILYLSVTNNFNSAITLKQIAYYNPSFLNVNITNNISDISISPRQTILIPVNISVSESIQPGKQLIYFELFFEWMERGHKQNGNFIVPQDLNLDVFGESEILALLGVPSLLLAPGVIAIITFGLLWRTFNPMRGKEFSLSIKTPEFWVVAITLSLMMAGIYPVVTKYMIGTQRNYVETYSFIDVVYSWFVSLALAFVGMIFFTISIRAFGLFQLVRTNIYSTWLYPTNSDDPLTVLTKLHRQKLGIYLPRILFKVDDETQTAFLFEPESSLEEKEKVWVGPPILIEWLDGDDAFKNAVRKQIGKDANPLVLNRILSDGKKSGKLIIRWKNSERIIQPLLIKKKDILSTHGSNIIFEQE